jgi:hypothetical protein
MENKNVWNHQPAWILVSGTGGFQVSLSINRQGKHGQNMQNEPQIHQQMVSELPINAW